MGCKVFGRREGVPYVVKEATGVEDCVFVKKSATSGERYVDLASADLTWKGGLIGVIQTGNWHGCVGSATDKYPSGADVSVVSNGQVRVKILQTDSGQADYLKDGDLVCVGTGGKAKKWAAPTIAPTMTATMGDTNVGAIITGATATLSADPTATEVKAWAEEVIEKTITAEALKIAAYITEFVGDYKAAFLVGYENCVGRCVGNPSGGLVTVELNGLGGIQNG